MIRIKWEEALESRDFPLSGQLFLIFSKNM